MKEKNWVMKVRNVDVETYKRIIYTQSQSWSIGAYVVANNKWPTARRFSRIESCTHIHADYYNFCFFYWNCINNNLIHNCIGKKLMCLYSVKRPGAWGVYVLCYQLVLVWVQKYVWVELTHSCVSLSICVLLLFNFIYMYFMKWDRKSLKEMKCPNA